MRAPLRAITPAVVLAIAVAATGCGPSSGAAARGFGSRQIVKVRDPDLGLGPFTKDGNRVYLGRSFNVTRPDGNDQRRADLSLFDLGSGATTPVVDDAVVAFLQPNSADPGAGQSLVAEHYEEDGSVTLSLIDEGDPATGGPGRLDIHNIAEQSLRVGPTRADPIVVARVIGKRADGMDDRGALFGPPAHLTTAPIGVTDADVAGVNDAGAFVRLATPQPGREDSITIGFLPFDGSLPAEVVSAAPSQVRTLGDEPRGPLEPAPARIDTKASPRFVCPSSPEPLIPATCYLIYRRVMSDGEPHAFVRVLHDATEMMLPGVQDKDFFGSPEISSNGGALIWIAPGADGQPNRLYTWVVGGPAAGSCSVAGDRLFVTDWFGGDQGVDRFVAVVIGPRSDQPVSIVVGASGADCQAIDVGQDSVGFVDGSPDGSRYVWVQSTSNGDSTIHLSASDGSGDRVIGSGPSFFTTSFLDNRRVLLSRGSGDGTGLSWLDLDTDPAAEHPLVERLFGTRSWLSSRWLLLGSNYSQQDDNGTLGLLDIDSGETRLVSKGVTSLSPRWPASTRASAPSPDRGPMPVAYLVRGRVASDQDGIWLAEIPLADFAAPPP